MRIVAGYGRVPTRFVKNCAYLLRTLQKSVENVQQAILDDGEYDGVIRILNHTRYSTPMEHVA